MADGPAAGALAGAVVPRVVLKDEVDGQGEEAGEDGLVGRRPVRALQEVLADALQPSAPPPAGSTPGTATSVTAR